MTKGDLERTRAAVDALGAKIDAILDQGPRLLVVTINGRTVNIRSTDPTVKVDILELDLPEGEDPPLATTRNYPFEIY